MSYAPTPENSNPISIREQTLSAAAACVLQDRNKTYGGPEDSFKTTAAFWTTFLGVEIKASDVAAMLALLKLARIAANPTHYDSYVDLAGYAACGAEVACSVNPEKASGG
jgi:hypothetical protein